MKRAVEAAIRIGAIAGLIVWCFIIARPFLIPIVWGAIIAVAIFHGYEKLRGAFGGRRITARADHVVNAGSVGRAIGAPWRFACERRALRRGLFSEWRTPHSATAG